MHLLQNQLVEYLLFDQIDLGCEFYQIRLFIGNTFVWFIKILDNWLKLYENFRYNEVIIILDNWSIHKGKLTQGLLKKLSYKVFYIPANSSEFAPVEMSFSLLKRTLSESNKNKDIKFSFRQNLSKIYQSLQSLISKTIIKLEIIKFYKMKDQEEHTESIERRKNETFWVEILTQYPNFTPRSWNSPS